MKLAGAIPIARTGAGSVDPCRPPSRESGSSSQLLWLGPATGPAMGRSALGLGTGLTL